ncbi:MAG: efflux RND transporter periplasmic adaptor subunit [Armatimonadota bacterium]
MKLWFVLITFLLVLGALIGWRVSQVKMKKTNMAGQRQMRSGAVPSVTVAPAEVRDIVKTFNATGTVEAPLNVKLAPKITGRIEYLQVREGDRVRKGQVLVRLDTNTVEANVQQQKANLAAAQYRLAQAQISQTPTDIAIVTQIRQQEAAVASARADYAQVQENIKAQYAAAMAGVSDVQGKIDGANAAMANAKAVINSAQANLDNANTKYNRVLDLYKQGFIAAQDVDDAKATLSVQQANVEVAKGQLAVAQASRDSATAQKLAAEQQASIVKTKGKADVEAANARLRQAQAALESAKANTAQSPAYQQNLSALRAGVDAARAALQNAVAQRSDTVLIAPMDGFVTGRFADPGSLSSPSQPIIAVQFLHQVWVTLAVPEDVCTKIHIGQPGTVKFDTYGDKTFTGSIVQINPAADPVNRQFTVRVIMDNSRSQFKPGMFAHVSIETERVPSAIVVPQEAVKQDPEGGQYVVVVKDVKEEGAGARKAQVGTAERRPVVLGASDANVYAITAGVKPGEKVVTVSSFPVRDGKVRLHSPRTGKSGSPDHGSGSDGDSGAGSREGHRPKRDRAGAGAQGQ